MTQNASMIAVARHPWHRWFARVWLDYVFAGLIFAVLLAIVSPGNPLLSSDYGLMWTASLLWIPVEAVLVSKTGTTPGKYLVGMRIEKLDGGLLSLSESFSRSASAWAIGCALMIPLVLLFTFNRQYNRLRKGGDCSWDEKGGFAVIHTSLTFSRSLLLVLVVLGILGLVVLGTMASATSQ